jgi:hypothetical protein
MLVRRPALIYSRQFIRREARRAVRGEFKFRDLLSDPRKALFGQLTLYYAALSLVVLLFARISPGSARYLYTWRSTGAEHVDLAAQLTADNTFTALQAETAVALFVSTVGALVLMVPVTWVYMGTRRRRGLDQSMVESLLMLPVAVAGVVVIVQDSLALAFSLAGIFAGIQFRSRLKFYADAHFMFTSIGVGLAAGIGALHIAGVMSLCFNYVAYTIWRLNYGAESGERHLRFATDGAKEKAHRRKVDRLDKDSAAPPAAAASAEAAGAAENVRSESVSDS